MKRVLYAAPLLALFLVFAGAQDRPVLVPAGKADPKIPPDTEKVTTPSGLVYSVLVEGKEGPKPGLFDKVKVHYTGWLPDGTMFDSSLKRGEPAEFRVNRVIPGWTEALQLMTPGAKFKLTIPPDLAYGDEGRPPLIPPKSTLVFVVELLDVIKGPPVPPFHEGDPKAQKKLENGLVYETIHAGKGARPGKDEWVQIRYALWNTEGKLLDCSEMHDGEIKYPLGKAKLAVFNEGVGLLHEGERARFVVPPELAFGDAGFQDLVPGGVKTIWEFELLKVMKPMPLPPFAKSAPDKVRTTPSGLKYEVIKEGEGANPKDGQTVEVRYAGWLEDGTLFDSTYQRGDTASFVLGRVIPGWNEGLRLMKPGAVYRLTIPPELAYGARGAPPRIPPDATLIFYVELLGVR